MKPDARNRPAIIVMKQGISRNTANTKRSKKLTQPLMRPSTDSNIQSLIGTARNPQFILFWRAEHRVVALVLAVFESKTAAD